MRKIEKQMIEAVKSKSTWNGLLFTTYEARCIFARTYDLLTHRFGA